MAAASTQYLCSLLWAAGVAAVADVCQRLQLLSCRFRTRADRLQQLVVPCWLEVLAQQACGDGTSSSAKVFPSARVSVHVPHFLYTCGRSMTSRQRCNLSTQQDDAAAAACLQRRLSAMRHPCSRMTHSRWLPMPLSSGRPYSEARPAPARGRASGCHLSARESRMTRARSACQPHHASSKKPRWRRQQLTKPRCGTLAVLRRMKRCSPSCFVSQMSSAAAAAQGMLSSADAPFCPLDSSSSGSSLKPCTLLGPHERPALVPDIQWRQRSSPQPT